MSEYVEHPLIEPNSIEKRAYQENIIKSASKRNTLVVLPTGIGKTIIGVGVAANRLQIYPNSKILVMAPSKPLVEQHKKSFEKMLILDSRNFKTLTGIVSPTKRRKEWEDTKLVFATPQVIQNDLRNGLLSLENYSMLLIDECHRSIGSYAYTGIAKDYIKQAKNPLILGLTASPGATKEKIGRICGNLFIENVEIRSEKDHDVEPYMQPLDIEWVEIELPPVFKVLLKHIDNAIEKRMKYVMKHNFVRSTKIGKGQLLRIQKEILARLSHKKDPYLFPAISDITAVIKLKHAQGLLQSQGITQLYNYLTKLQHEKETKATKMILNDPDIKELIDKTTRLYYEGIKHPKINKIIEILKNEVKEGKKAIVFTQYVDTVNKIYSNINAKVPELKSTPFIGQRKGHTQKDQLKTLENFRKGEYKVLIATSIGEEGLDIPELDLVLFYEPIPSEIRVIQRRGRTARKRPGKVIILMAKNTIDAAYYWSSYHKEKKMKKILHEMKNAFDASGTEVKSNKIQESLDKYKDNKDIPIIYTDKRENGLLEELKDRGVIIREKQLDVGDYILSERVCIERKTTADFLQSLIDKRLFKQMEDLNNTFEKPILIIEGENLYTERNIHPNAIRGALIAITTDYRIPIIWTKNIEETALIMIMIAKREQIENKRDIQIRGSRKPKTLSEIQEYILSGFPDINIILGKRLLEEFKTIKNFVNASEGELQKIDGLGKEKVKKIKKVIDSEYINEN